MVNAVELVGQVLLAVSRHIIVPNSMVSWFFVSLSGRLDDDYITIFQDYYYQCL